MLLCTLAKTKKKHTLEKLVCGCWKYIFIVFFWGGLFIVWMKYFSFAFSLEKYLRIQGNEFFLNSVGLFYLLTMGGDRLLQRSKETPENNERFFYFGMECTLDFGFSLPLPPPSLPLYDFTKHNVNLCYSLN